MNSRIQREHAKVMGELARAKRPDLKPGVFVNIHHRLCSDKIQPNVRASSTWKVLEVLAPTKSGAIRAKCQERNFSKREHELDICIINAERFDFKLFTEAEVMKVERLGVMMMHDARKSIQAEKEINYYLELERKKAEQLQKDHEMASKILDNCTEQEQLKVSFVHLVLADLAWMYLDACQAMACNLRIQETKSLNRAINDYKKQYEEFIHSCVDPHTAGMIRENSRQISANEEFSKISHDAWNAIELMYNYKFGKDKVPYLELRICAQLGQMMLKSYYYAIDQSNAILKEKMQGLPHSEHSAANPMLETVEGFFDAFQGDFTLEYDSVMRTFVERWNDVFNRVQFVWGQPKIYLHED